MYNNAINLFKTTNDYSHHVNIQLTSSNISDSAILNLYSFLWETKEIIIFKWF